MACKLDPELTQALSGEYTPKFLATLDADGQPNCVPVTTIMPYDDETLIFGEFLMVKTRKNLLANPNVGVAVVNDRFETWSLKGTFLGFETTGERIDIVNRLPMFRYNAYTSVRAAGLIRVEDVSEKRSITKGQLVCDFLRARVLAPFLKRPSNSMVPGVRKPGHMHPRIAEKFARISAVRAAAFRDADRFPRAFGTMVTMPAGPNRLLMADSLFAAYASALAVGTPLAISVITRDPIAYQVKGHYRGRRAGLGLIDLTACYSASPPLLGERLDA